MSLHGLALWYSLFLRKFTPAKAGVGMRKGDSSAAVFVEGHLEAVCCRLEVWLALVVLKAKRDDCAADAHAEVFQIAIVPENPDELPESIN